MSALDIVLAHYMDACVQDEETRANWKAAVTELESLLTAGDGMRAVLHDLAEFYDPEALVAATEWDRVRSTIQPRQVTSLEAQRLLGLDGEANG